MKLGILSLVLFILFSSCSRSEPRIHHGFMELVYYSTRDGIEERFTFFVLAEDDDGNENLSELYLFHDREGLRWEINAEDWVSHIEDGSTWIGSRSIAMTGNTTLPRGLYRAVLVNKGGERTERNFTFDSPVRSPYFFPSFAINGDNYRIESQYPVNHFVVYDQQGRTIDTILVRENEGRIQDLRLSGNARNIALWSSDPDYLISAFTDAISIR